MYTDRNKHPVEHAGLVAPGRHNRFQPLLLLLSKLEDKTCEGVLCGYSLNCKAFQIYRNKTARVTESRNVSFIETPASTLAGITGGNTTGDAVSTHEDSSPAQNTENISITYSEEIDSLLKKVSKLTSRNMAIQPRLAWRSRPLKVPAVTRHPRRPGQEPGRQATKSEPQHVRAHAQIVP